MTRVLACHKCDQGVFNECVMVLRISYFCRQCSEKAVPISVNLSYLCRLFQFRLFLTPYSAWHALTHYLQPFTVVLPPSRCSWLEREFPRPRPDPPDKYLTTASKAYSNNGGPLRNTADFKTPLGLSPHYRRYVKQIVCVIDI